MGGNAWGPFQLEVPASCREERGQRGRLPTRAPWAVRPPSQLPGPTDRSRRPVCGLCLCAAIVGKALPVQAPCTLVLLTCLLTGPRHTQAQEGAQTEDAHPPPGTQPRPWGAFSLREAPPPPASGRPPYLQVHSLQPREAPPRGAPTPAASGSAPRSLHSPTPVLSAIDTFPSSKGCMFSLSGLQITSNFTVFFP